MKTKINIVIADDHTLFIEGLKSILQTEKNLNIIGTTTNGKELITLLKDKSPDLALIDINMPVLNGLDAVVQIRQWNPTMKIIMLSTYGESYLIEKAKANGANGYLLKTSPKDQLVNTINEVYAGKTHFIENTVTQNPTSFDQKDDFLKKFNLTRRELEIIQFIKEGLTSKEIAEKLFLSYFTVKTHRQNIIQKLEVSNINSLIKFIHENNL